MALSGISSHKQTAISCIFKVSPTFLTPPWSTVSAQACTWCQLRLVSVANSDWCSRALSKAPGFTAFSAGLDTDFLNSLSKWYGLERTQASKESTQRLRRMSCLQGWGLLFLQWSAKKRHCASANVFSVQGGSFTNLLRYCLTAFQMSNAFMVSLGWPVSICRSFLLFACGGWPFSQQAVLC